MYRNRLVLLHFFPRVGIFTLIDYSWALRAAIRLPGTHFLKWAPVETFDGPRNFLTGQEIDGFQANSLEYFPLE
jgi:hypothetical protein